MICPNKTCKSKNLKVQTVITQYPSFTHRYIICEDCRTVFQTIEKVVADTIKEGFYDRIQEEMDFKEKK
jgi:hypothetical protein